MYELFWSRGNGTYEGPKFRRLEDALRYMHRNEGKARFWIKKPCGAHYSRERWS